MANYLGTSVEYDILLISMAIPMMIANILFMAIPSAGIPYLQQTREISSAGSEINEPVFIKANSIIILLISVFIFFALPLFRGILAQGIDDTQIDKIIFYGRIFCFLIPIRAYEGVFRALLQFRRNFLFPAMTILGFNLGIILVLLTLFPSIGTPAYIVAWFVGTISQLLIVAIPSYLLIKRNVKTEDDRARLDSAGYFKYLSVIAFIESLGLIIDPFDRFLAGTFLSEGYVSANYYALIIGSVPIRILIYALGTAIFPSLSEYVAEGNIIKVRKLYHKAIKVCLVLIIPTAVYLYLFSGDIVKILFERGKFGAGSRIMTTEVLRYYLLGMVFHALFFIQLRVAYAIKLRRYLILSRILSFAIKGAIGLTFIGTDWALAIGGGTIAMFTVNYFLMEIVLIRKSGLIYLYDDVRNIMKALCGAAIPTLFIIGTYYVFHYVLSLGALIPLVAVGAAGLSGLFITDRWLGITGFSAKSKG